MAVLVYAPEAVIPTTPFVATAPVVAVVTRNNEPVVNPVPVLLTFNPTPVVKAFAVTLSALPFVVFAELKLRRFPVPVVLEPVMLTALPVNPVVTPDWMMFKIVAVV